jgi:hypothetical protein
MLNPQGQSLHHKRRPGGKLAWCPCYDKCPLPLWQSFSGKEKDERRREFDSINIYQVSTLYNQCIPMLSVLCGTRWFPRITLLETPLHNFLSWKDHGLRNAWNGFAHLGGAQPDRSLLIFGSGLQTKANGADKSKERHSWVRGQWGQISIAMLCPEVRLWG